MSDEALSRESSKRGLTTTAAAAAAAAAANNSGVDCIEIWESVPSVLDIVLGLC